jgi:hypothetical protein
VTGLVDNCHAPTAGDPLPDCAPLCVCDCRAAHAWACAAGWLSHMTCPAAPAQAGAVTRALPQLPSLPSCMLVFWLGARGDNISGPGAGSQEGGLLVAATQAGGIYTIQLSLPAGTGLLQLPVKWRRLSLPLLVQADGLYRLPGDRPFLLVAAASTCPAEVFNGAQAPKPHTALGVLYSRSKLRS